MKLTKNIAAAICLAASINAADAQEYYDITEHYLQNANFEEHIDYDANAADSIEDGVREVPGWTVETKPTSFTLGAVLEYGSKAHTYNSVTPAAGPNGEAQGSGLLLTAAQFIFIKYSQEILIPAGNYKLIINYYNCNPDADKSKSQCGWVATESVMSELGEFEYGVWKNDTIEFLLTNKAKGRVQVGLTGAKGRTNENAMLIIDNVKLLRDQPYGDIDNVDPSPTVNPDIVVETDPRFARGATMAFGRIKSVKGTNITERGFCWSETPDPVAMENVTTTMMTDKSGIYWLKDLKPATIYYMRAYAKNKNGEVGYGSVIKFSTVPKGNVTYWYNNGGDAAANNRVNAAATEACDIFNNLTEIVKKYNIGYSAGTPTADCYYGDEPWMNMGPNSSYQRTGTIMHEMQHGLGLVPYSTQWNKNILRERLDGDGRGTGHWLGERVTEFLDFWDNTTGSQLNGDYQHMWPYGVNGAHEDTESKALYYANAMIGQALGEDGLEHRSNTFAEPCYIFTQEDNIKYYLQCESDERGLGTSYLVPSSTGILRWRTMSASEALQNDSTAWYITFTPANQYYQLRNVATGQNLTYSGSFKTVKRTTLTANDNFHLMKGRVDVNTEGVTKRGYWLVHPTGNLSPNCIQANANGNVGSATFNIANTATNQRWLIYTGKELAEPGDLNCDGLKNAIDVDVVLNAIAGIRTDSSADVNGDGKVNIADILTVINCMSK